MTPEHFCNGPGEPKLKIKAENRRKACIIIFKIIQIRTFEEINLNLFKTMFPGIPTDLTVLSFPN